MSDLPQRDFKLSTILSVTTDAFLSSLDETADLMLFLTGGDEIMIRLALRASLSRESILRQHEGLAAVELPNLDSLSKDKREQILSDWLAAQEKRFGQTLRLSPLNETLEAAHAVHNDFLRSMGLPTAGEEPQDRGATTPVSAGTRRPSGLDHH